MKTWMMTMLALSSIAVLAFACCSDETDNGLTGYPIEGEGCSGCGSGQAHLAVTETSTKKLLACETTTATDGKFKFELGKVVDPKTGHRVDIFIDVDGNQRCEFGVDAVMSSTSEPGHGVAELIFAGVSRIGDSPAGCAAFGGESFRITVSGVTKGHLHYALVRMSTNGTAVDKVILVGDAFTEDGVATIEVEGAGQQGRFYRIDFFETDASDDCTAQTAVLRVSTGASGEDKPFGCVSALATGSLERHGDITKSNDFETGECSSFKK